MRVAYLDPSSGVSGDLLLGALVDAGVPLTVLQQAVDRLGVEGLVLHAAKVARAGIAATKVTVVYPEQDEHRHLGDIRGMIENAGLSQAVCGRALGVFTRLAEVEARVHGVTVDEVHFHEVGAADALADVVGTVVGFDALAVERLLVGPVNVGSGRVTCAHGTLPVPAPATAGLLEGWECYVAGPSLELTTPTGAAVVTTFGEQVGAMPPLRVERRGCGAALHDPPGWANVLRLAVGELDAPTPA